MNSHLSFCGVSRVSRLGLGGLKLQCFVNDLVAG